MTLYKQKLFSFLGGVFAIVIVLLLIIATVSFIQQNTDDEDKLASHLGKMVELRTKVTYRIGLLKSLAIQGKISGKDYWEIQNDYVNLSASYNGCLASIVAQVELRNEVTQTEMECFLLESNYKNFIQKTEEWIKPKEMVVKMTPDGQRISSIAQIDTDDSNKQSSQLREIRSQSQSTKVNLLESFKWPDIDVIRPQLLIGTGKEQQPQKENTSPFDCKGLDLTAFINADKGTDNYIKSDELHSLLDHLEKERFCK